MTTQRWLTPAGLTLASLTALLGFIAGFNIGAAYVTRQPVVTPAAIVPPPLTVQSWCVDSPDPQNRAPLCIALCADGALSWNGRVESKNSGVVFYECRADDRDRAVKEWLKK